MSDGRESSKKTREELLSSTDPPAPPPPQPDDDERRRCLLSLSLSLGYFSHFFFIFEESNGILSLSFSRRALPNTRSRLLLAHFARVEFGTSAKERRKLKA